MTKTFPIGGIHPDKHKIAGNIPISDPGLPETVYIPIKQHIGTPAKILVGKGDKVKVGTLLAAADGVVSCPCSFFCLWRSNQSRRHTGRVWIL